MRSLRTSISCNIFSETCPPSISGFRNRPGSSPTTLRLRFSGEQTVERVTFAELTRMSESVANWLSTRVPRDARVAILAANHPRWVAAYLGIIAAGTNGGSARHGFPRRSGEDVADRQRRFPVVLRCEASSGGDGSGRGTQPASGDDFGCGGAGRDDRGPVGSDPSTPNAVSGASRVRPSMVQPSMV